MASDSLVTRHSSEFGDWEAIHRAPHPKLRPYVTRLSGWVERTSFSRRREVPGTICVLIINIENRLKVSDPRNPERLESFHSFFAGLTTGYVVTESSGVGGGIQVDFTPIGAYLFLGRAAHEVTDRVVHLDDVLGLEGARLTRQLEDTPDWESRFDLVEDLVFRRLANAPAGNRGVAWAWARIQESEGLTSIAGLSQHLGWTPRQLIDGFREEIGLAPKQMARLVRFTRATTMLEGEGRPSFAAVAADCGYYDQAHFAREFREFAGSTPSEFVARLVPESGGVLDADPGIGFQPNAALHAQAADPAR